MNVGINLSGINYYTPQWWDVNIANWTTFWSANYFKSWINSQRSVTLRNDGYPVSLVSLTGQIEQVEIQLGQIVITSTNHQLVSNDVILLKNFSSSPSIDSQQTVKVLDENRFMLTETSGISSAQAIGTWEFRQKVHGLTVRSIGSHYPKGDYLFKAEGKGVITVRFSTPWKEIRCNGGETKTTIPVTPDSSGIELSIIETDPNDPIRNLRIFMPGFDDGDEFHPLFLERLKPFSCIRFMDTNAINGSNVSKWSQRTRPDWQSKTGYIEHHQGSIESTSIQPLTNHWTLGWGKILRVVSPNHGLISGHSITITVNNGVKTYTFTETPIRVLDENTFETRIDPNIAEVMSSESYSGAWRLRVASGIPYEYMVRLCNELNSDMWICVPHLADDDYIINLAQLIKDQLNPNLKVYLEWSNEVWNYASAFKSFWANLFKAVDQGIDFNYAYADQSKRVFDLFISTFQEQKDRLVRVIAGQTVVPYRVQKMLERLNGDVDAVSCTTYFGVDTTGFDANTTIDEFCDRIIEGAKDPNTVTGIMQHGELAKKYGVRFIAYEGGQHITANGNLNHPLINLFWASQTDLRMKTAYQEMFNNFRKAGGDLMVAFNSISPNSQWGSWGHLEYQDSPVDSPKYAALIEEVERDAKPTAIFRLSWNKSKSEDVIKQILRCKIGSNSSVAVELQPSVEYYDIRLPEKTTIEASVTAFDGTFESEIPVTFVVPDLVKPNPPTNLNARII